MMQEAVVDYVVISQGQLKRKCEKPQFQKMALEKRLPLHHSKFEFLWPRVPRGVAYFVETKGSWLKKFKMMLENKR
jgi:hypothetical protein